MSSQKNEVPENYPSAILVERETLRKARIEIQDLPVAEISSSPSAQVGTAPVREIAAAKEPREPREPRGFRPAVSEKVGRAAVGEKMPIAQGELQRTPAIQKPLQGEEASINRKALESTNRGVSPRSRRFVRGILHPSPVKMLAAAFFAIAVRLTLIAVVVLMALIVFGAIENIWVWGALAFPIVAVTHLITVSRARCRVCGQKEFVKSRAHKHQKAHRLLFFGPIISTGVHLFIFKWFHCMFCGTAIRVKK